MSNGKLIAAVGLFAVIFYFRKNAQSMMISTADALQNKNVQAFLAMIRRFESGGRYDILFHTPHSDPTYDPTKPLYFTDYSDHPNIHIPFTDPRTGKPNYSTAAGAYQITHPTWNTITDAFDLPDFSPASQDAAAVDLLSIDGALADIVAGNFQDAIDAANTRWASLPGSDSKQPQQSFDRALAVYQQAGGAVA